MGRLRPCSVLLETPDSCNLPEVGKTLVLSDTKKMLMAFVGKVVIVEAMVVAVEVKLAAVTEWEEA